MERETLFIFVMGFSFLMSVTTIFKSYLNQWDKAYLYCGLLFVCAFLNGLFWTIDGNVIREETYSDLRSIGLWFNHLTPFFLLLLYREFLNIKTLHKRFYELLNIGLSLIVISLISLIVFTFVPDVWNINRMLHTTFLITLFILFTLLPLYTFQFFSHKYYVYAAISSWVIWLLYGTVFLANYLVEVDLFKSTFIVNGDLLFVIIIIDGILFLVALAVKDKLIQNERIKFEKEALNHKIAALKAQMNPHFIFNSLNSIKSLNVDGRYEEANYYLNKFGTLLREVLNTSRKTTITLKEEIDNLKHYLVLEKLRLGKKLNYSIDIEEGIEPELIDIPPLIIQPYVENAIWHGISLIEKEQGFIKIIIQMKSPIIKVNILDNGIGYFRNIQQKKEKKSQNSLATKINAERIDSINTINNQNGLVQIRDINGQFGWTTGTEVNLEIPIAL